MKVLKSKFKPSLFALLVFSLISLLVVLHFSGSANVKSLSDDLMAQDGETSENNEVSNITNMERDKKQKLSQEKPPRQIDDVDTATSRLNTNDSYRALYAQALKIPEKGGIFYASRILSMCSAIVNQTAVGVENETRISATADGLRAKCSTFTSEELSQQYIYQIEESDASLKDPLMAAGKSLGVIGGYGDVERKKQLLDDDVKIADPVFISDLGMRLALFIRSDSNKVIFKFGGKDYPLDSKIDVGFALYMLPCALGMQCDKNEPDMALKCESDAGCYEGRVDYVRKVMTSASRDYDGTMKLYEQMADAVKKGDLTKFMD